MSTRCGHENADHLMPGDHGQFEDDDLLCRARVGGVIVEQFRCLDCGAWLSLGAANDEPAEVQVEIRAAELAVGVPFEEIELTDRAEFLDGNDECRSCLIWRLAHAIATHDATHEHEGGEL